MDLAEIKIYRLTHIDNIPHILQFGITHRNSQNQNPNFKTIGDISLIETRNEKKVKVDNGDLSINVPEIILGDFIPFYFGVRMPMLYVTQNGGNFVTHATPAQDIIYMVCSLVSIIKSVKVYYFSDGHATNDFTAFYDSTKIDELTKIIDWEAVTAQYWGSNDNLNLKRKKQAEFLTSDDIASNLIIGFGCYNKIAEGKLLEIGIPGNKIKIIPNAYY